MSDSEEKVQCAQHGSRNATFVCQHLAARDGSGAGFYWAEDDEEPDAPWPDAWCEACEEVRSAEGEWNDRSEAFANIRLLCDACYEQARERNWKQDNQAYDALLAEAHDYLTARQDELRDQFGLESYDRYHWNAAAGQLTLSTDGQVQLIAGVQMVGSVSTRSHTWLWSWANRHLEPFLKQDARRVRAYGEEHRLLKLASARWSADEIDGWEMTAIAAKLLDAKGAYRLSYPEEGQFWYMVLTSVDGPS